MAKHAAPRYVRTKKVIARAPVAAGATVVGLGFLSSPAQAPTRSVPGAPPQLHVHLRLQLAAHHHVHLLLAGQAQALP